MNGCFLPTPLVPAGASVQRYMRRKQMPVMYKKLKVRVEAQTEIIWEKGRMLMQAMMAMLMVSCQESVAE